MTAPEKIWAWTWAMDYPSKMHGQRCWAVDIRPLDQGGVEYTRADLCITRADAEAMVLAERDRVLGIMRIGSADVDRLRLVAFSSNAERDKFNYHNACAKWFNERHFRELEAAAIRKEPRP